MKEDKIKNRIKLFIIFSVFLLSLIVHGYKIKESRFGIDQSSHFDIIYNFVKNGIIPYEGPDIGYTKVKLGPIYYYIFLIPALFSLNPVLTLYFSLLLNSLSIFLIFAIFKKRFRFWVPFITSLLYATSPYLSYVTREIWNLTPLPFFMTLFIYFLFEWIETNRKIYIYISFFMVGLLSQLHIVSIIYLLILIYLLFNRNGKSKKMNIFLIGIFSFLISYLPFIIYQLMNRFKMITDFLEYLSKGGNGNSSINLNAFYMLFEYPKWFFNYIFYYDSIIFKSTLYNFTNNFHMILFILSIFYGIYILKTLEDSPMRREILILFSIIFLPSIFLMIFNEEILDRHLLMIYPANFMMIAIFLDGLIEKRIKIVTLFSIFSVFFLVFTMFIYNMEFYNQIDRTQMIKEEIPLKTKEKILKYIVNKNGKIGGNNLSSIIHPFSILDTSGVFKNLYKLFWGEEEKSYDINKEHYLIFRNEKNNILKRGIFREKKEFNNIEVAGYLPLIDYNSIMLKKNGDLDWEKIITPFSEEKDMRGIEVKGVLNFNDEKSEEVFIVVFTNLFINEFKINNHIIKSYKPYISQSSNNEISSSERIFKIDNFLKNGKNNFYFKIDSISRWYTININDFEISN